MKRWIRSNTEVDSDIEDIWFVQSDDEVENCCIHVKGYEKSMRGRSSMICLDYIDDEFFILTKPNENDYGVPGGGWNEGEDPKDAAIRELQEETRSNVTEVRRMNTLIEYHEEVQDWVREHVANPDDWWYGYYSAVFVGKYDGIFTGHIDDQDKETGYHWCKLSDVEEFLPDEYQSSIDAYIEKFYI